MISRGSLRPWKCPEKSSCGLGSCARFWCYSRWRWASSGYATFRHANAVRPRLTEYALATAVTLVLLMAVFLRSAWAQADLMKEQAARYEELIERLDAQRGD